LVASSAVGLLARSRFDVLLEFGHKELAFGGVIVLEIGSAELVFILELISTLKDLLD